MKLKKELGFLDIFCIAAGSMISSGLFVLPGLAYAKTGPGVVVSYLLASLLIIPSVLSKAELATAMPKAGGTYFYIERSLGAFAGTLGGLASWFSISFKSAFALLGMGAFALLIYPNITPFQIKLITVGFCIFFTLVNIISVKTTGRFQVFLVFGLISILVLYIFLGLPEVKIHNYTPFLPFGTKSIFATAGLVFISYGGLTKIASVAEEIKRPERNIPLGMFSVLLIVGILYVMVIFTTVGVVEGSRLKFSLTPISLGAGSFMGIFGIILLSIGAILAFITTANAGILSASRTPMAMSRDQILPHFLQKINIKFKTPHLSILFTSIFMILVVLFLDFENFVKVASTLKILLFILVNLSVIVMRESKLRNYRPKFHSPFYPYIQIIGIILYGFLIFEMGKISLLITSIFIIAGFIWYWLYVRSKIYRQAAIVHVVERITAKELAGSTLEKELKEILIERDSITEDKFDRLIKECDILDLKGALDLKDFFSIVADTLSKRLNIDRDVLFNLLMEREKESTTAIHPGFAIPHIIIEGNHKFDILLARCREGITFSPSLPPVHIVFVIVSTYDERSYYLRALMAIAQIAQDPNFEEHWLKARNLEELRDIILLSDRRRIL